MNTKKTLGTGLLIITLFVAFAGLTQTASAQTTPSDSRVRATLYGLHTLNVGQSARLSVINRQPLSEREIIPCVKVRVVFDIYEASLSEPTRLRFVRRLEREVTLDRGEAFSLDFPASRTGGERISASVFARPLEGERGEAEAISTLEVRESGRTLLTLPSVRKGFDPQPDPPNLP